MNLDPQAQAPLTCQSMLGSRTSWQQLKLRDSYDMPEQGITIRGSAECAVWGHIKDLWSFRDSFRLIPRYASAPAQGLAAQQYRT